MIISISILADRGEPNSHLKRNFVKLLKRMGAEVHIPFGYSDQEWKQISAHVEEKCFNSHEGKRLEQIIDEAFWNDWRNE